MSALWFTYLLTSRRLPKQPFRKWDRFLFVVFILLTAALIQFSLYILNISETHQRQTLGRIALVTFLVLGGGINVISNYWKV